MTPLPPEATPATQPNGRLSQPYRRLLQRLARAVTGWEADTGTAKRTANAAYVAPTISDPPTQAEVQAMADAVQDISQTLKAIKDDLIALDVLAP